MASPSSLWSQLQERLILWQLGGESELFRHLNLLRLSQNDQNIASLGLDEAKYFHFYQTCFMLEGVSFVFLAPVGFYGFKFYKALKQQNLDPKVVKNRMVRLLLCGVPTLNLFLFNAYRRFLHTLTCEKTLERKYAQEIREMKRRKRELEKA